MGRVGLLEAPVLGLQLAVFSVFSQGLISMSAGVLLSSSNKDQPYRVRDHAGDLILTESSH